LLKENGTSDAIRSTTDKRGSRGGTEGGETNKGAFKGVRKERFFRVGSATRKKILFPKIPQKGKRNLGKVASQKKKKKEEV